MVNEPNDDLRAISLSEAEKEWEKPEKDFLEENEWFDTRNVNLKKVHEMSLDEVLILGPSQNDLSQGLAVHTFDLPIWMWATMEQVRFSEENMSMGKVVSLILKHGTTKIQHAHAKKIREYIKVRNELYASPNNQLLETFFSREMKDGVEKVGRSVRIFSWAASALKTIANKGNLPLGKITRAAIAYSVLSWSGLIPQRKPLCEESITIFANMLDVQYALVGSAVKHFMGIEIKKEETDIQTTL